MIPGTILAIDSGTTTTRVRAVTHGSVTWSGAVQVGARDTAIDGSNSRVHHALKHLIQDARAANPDIVEAAICSGMITSNMGLLEIPHIAAPASRQTIADGLVRHDFPDITDLPMVFVPGVKTVPASFNLHTLVESDVLRGEECECEGLRQLTGLDTACTYLHFGSHHKAIEVDAHGTITASRTGITGELLAAVTEHTILKSSVADPYTVPIQDEYVRAGVEACRDHGVARALFLVRVGEQLWQRSPEQMTSFLLGVLAYSDIQLVGIPDRNRQLVLYGSGPFPTILEPTLEQLGHRVLRVDSNHADPAAAIGAASFYLTARNRLLRAQA